MEKNWLVIVNPNAGKRNGEKDWHIIEGLLKSKNITYKSLFTQDKHHAITLAKENITEEYKNIIVVGGDGTLNEVINGIFLQDKFSTTEITLGMINVGTGNDWGRMYDIPQSYKEAIEVIKNNKTFVQDAGLVKYNNSEGKQSRYFVNMAGMGFDAQVARRTNEQKEEGKGNAFSYLINIFAALWSHIDKYSEIQIDNHKFKGKIFSMNVGICKYNGNGMKQAPNAIPDDGLFDMTIIKKLGKFKVIKNVKKLYDGSFVKLPEVNTYQGKSISINSNTKIFLEADGESLGHTPFEFEIVPKSIKVIVS